MVTCICINDKNMPNDYPDKSKWIKENNKYKIIRVLYLTKSETFAVQLNEIDLYDKAPYYGWFRIHRFGIPEENLDEFRDLIEACNEEVKADELDLEKILNPELV